MLFMVVIKSCEDKFIGWRKSNHFFKKKEIKINRITQFYLNVYLIYLDVLTFVLYRIVLYYYRKSPMERFFFKDLLDIRNSKRDQ